MLDYVPECHMEQIYVSRADCADSSRPLVPEGLSYGQESGSELERFFWLRQPVLTLTAFLGYGVPQPFPLHHPSLDAQLWYDRGRQLEKAVGCPGRL